MSDTTQKIPRCERKKQRLAAFAASQEVKAAQKITEEARRAEYARLHPVSAGIIPVVDYVPPANNFKRS